VTAEDQIIHYLKDKVGLAEADRLIANLKEELVVKAEAEVHGCCDECNAAMRIARNAITAQETP
jgi:hypothetical protein